MLDGHLAIGQTNNYSKNGTKIYQNRTMLDDPENILIYCIFYDIVSYTLTNYKNENYFKRKTLY